MRLSSLLLQLSLLTMSYPISKSNNKLINNTLTLYLRTLLVMCIGLFTSRVILQVLGIDNFGIYNVVGGCVGMFAVVTQSLVSTTQRYITCELGKGENGNLRNIFGVVLLIHIVLAVCMILLFESIGLYFLNYKLQIPSNRLYAANWVFQISVITAVLGLFSTPYIGLIVSYEKMKAFAFISLQDAILKLGVCYFLYVCDRDRLILYAILIGGISVWNQFLYMMYCHKHFTNILGGLRYDRSLIKSIFSFAGLNFIGSFAHILSTEGLTLIINMWYGVAVNAARGIGLQVQNIVSRFTGDFMTALNPQITKEYSSGNKLQSQALCFRGAKFSFILVLIIALPIIFRTHTVLQLWLGEVPKYTIQFVQITLIMLMVNVLISPLVTMILAVGDIAGVSLWIGGIRLLTLPLVWVMFNVFKSPVSAYYTVLLMDIVLLYVRLIVLQRKTGLNYVSDMTKTVIVPVICAAAVTSLSTLILSQIIADNILGLILFGMCSVAASCLLIFVICLTQNERDYIMALLKLLKTKLFSANIS